MARPSSPTATEGFGFTYADKVGAICLLALLRRTSVGGVDLGVVVKVQFGQRPAGWHFDDIVLTLDRLGTRRRLAISVKSMGHVARSGVAKELSDLAWKQIQGGPPFDELTDSLALAQPSTTPEIQNALDELSRWSLRQEAGQTSQWVAQEGVGNDVKRALVASVERGGAEKDAQRFFRAFRVLRFDLDPPHDPDVATALRDCLAVLRRPSESMAEQLWSRLCQLAAEARPSSGVIDLGTLLRDLAPLFQLRESPLLEPDVLKLRRASESRHLPTVRDTIGLDLRLPTEDAERNLRNALDSHRVVFFVGPSGAGKSVVLKRLVEGAPESELALYLRADLSSVSPTKMARQLALTNDVPALFEAGRFARSTVVVDQVDRLLTEAQLADVVELLTSTKGCERLRLVFGCQSGEAERIISRLKEALPDGRGHRVDFSPDGEAVFAAVRNRFPQLQSLTFRPELRSLFVRPKNLDLLVRRLDHLGELAQGRIVSQKQFIDWFWSAYVDSGEDGIARSAAAVELAEVQASDLAPYVRPLGLSDRRALDSLRKSEIVAGDDRGVSFQHDLYGDWARLRSIESNRDHLTAFLSERGTNPLWLRSIRLWSATVLETEGAEAWRSTFDSFSERDGGAWMVRDAMLDGLSLAAGSYHYLSDLAPVLFGDGGKLLKRFLARFLFATTGPDERMASLLASGGALTPTALRARFRVPQWYLWWPVIRFLCENAEPYCELAPELVVEVLLPWLDALPKGELWGVETSRMALSMVDRRIEQERYGRRDDDEHAFRLFRCAFLALNHIPEEAVPLLRRAAGRSGEDPYPNAEWIKGERYVTFESSFDHRRSLVMGPWPDGPVRQGDDGLREFVLMGGGMREAHAHSPEFAREILMACVVEPPHPEPHNRGLRGFMIERSLCVYHDRSFSPPFHDKSLFGTLLAIDAKWAVGLILDIVRFASER